MSNKKQDDFSPKNIFKKLRSHARLMARLQTHESAKQIQHVSQQYFNNPNAIHFDNWDSFLKSN